MSPAGRLCGVVRRAAKTEVEMKEKNRALTSAARYSFCRRISVVAGGESRFLRASRQSPGQGDNADQDGRIRFVLRACKNRCPIVDNAGADRALFVNKVADGRAFLLQCPTTRCDWPTLRARPD